MESIMHSFIYLNRAKVESFFAQLNGYVIKEQKEQRTKGITGTGRVGAELGSILAKLGLAKGSAELELATDYSKMLEITTTLSIENKLFVLLAHLKNQKKVTEIDISPWSDPRIVIQEKNTEFQIVNGAFRAYVGELGPSETIKELNTAFFLALNAYGISSIGSYAKSGKPKP